MQTSFVKCISALFLAFVMYVVWNIVMLYFCHMLKYLMILINTCSCPSCQKPHGAKQMLSVYVSRMTHCTMLIIMRIVPVLYVLFSSSCSVRLRERLPASCTYHTCSAGGTQWALHSGPLSSASYRTSPPFHPSSSSPPATFRITASTQRYVGPFNTRAHTTAAASPTDKCEGFCVKFCIKFLARIFWLFKTWHLCFGM